MPKPITTPIPVLILAWLTWLALACLACLVPQPAKESGRMRWTNQALACRLTESEGGQQINTHFSKEVGPNKRRTKTDGIREQSTIGSTGKRQTLQCALGL